MELVADTNVIFSLFKKDSFTRRLVGKHNIKLFSPNWLIKELNKYSEVICSKAKISLESFDEAKESILKIVSTKEPSKEFLSKASKLISHESDAPFLALALELNIPVWSNDPHFQEQSVIDVVEVFKTRELKEFLDAE